jgi:hypothetical protein
MDFDCFKSILTNTIRNRTPQVSQVLISPLIGMWAGTIFERFVYGCTEFIPA